MYEERFGFSGSPFRLAPDPKFFFGTKSHNKAMSYLHYGLRQAEGFIVITGEIGAGKSILIGRLLDQLDRSNVVAATLATPNVPAADLLSHILSAFRIEPANAGATAEIEAFEDFLFDQMNHGRRVLLIVDEAQNLPLATLEELRVLSNLDYEGTPLFQVFLVGQPDFRDVLARADMEQLRQRVIAAYHLEPMTREETALYIEHRLNFVGWNGRPRLAREAFDAIFAATGGVPRKIHKLCNRLLLFASVEGLEALDGASVSAVLADMSAEQDAGARAPVAAVGSGLDAGAVATAVEEPKQDFAKKDAVAPPPVIETAPDGEGEKPMEAPRPSRPAAAPAAIAVASPAAPSIAESVFDRLRARKAGSPAEPRVAPAPDMDAAPPKPATLDDVANAIAAARVNRELVADNDDDAAPTGEDGVEDDAGREDETTPTGAGWSNSVIMSINETRDELKRAHQSVTRLRRKLTEIDKRREKRRLQITASLDRAESLLANFRDAWR